MKTVRASILLLTVACSGCTFGTRPLPDGFEVQATGTSQFFPFPYAEGGIYYDFIGIGWLAHDERQDRVRLIQHGRELAIASRQGAGGWDLTLAGRERIAKHGWSSGGFHSTILVGSASRAEMPPLPPRSPRKRSAPGMPYLNLPGETDYLYEWNVRGEPQLAVDERWDTVAFLLDSLSRAYIRMVGFDSSHYDWLESSVRPAGDELPGGYVIGFSLRDRRTGRTRHGMYLFPAGSGQVHLDEGKDRPLE